ncbi:tyrosine-protein phosphatase [Microbacterium sp. LWH13-1.2]|uniref:tyrosine-protein phosphatase n=1 Tax=Microbacterium sp. LWH13-1.2 TaxID=3135260 RepID=UPI0031394400
MSQLPLDIPGLANARDLGGLPRRDGSVTPHGVFIRSDAPDLVSSEGWNLLREHRVTTVIDLRRPDERTTGVPDDIDLIAVDLDGDERAFWEPLEADGRWGTPLYYGPHLTDLPHRMAGVLQAIATARPGGILFHCAAGWDRTGLVAMILLRALDVTTEAARRDYATSFANATRMEALRSRSQHAEERRAVLTRFGHTPESAFADAYESLDLEEWSRSAGLDRGVVVALRTWRNSVPSRGRNPS